MNILVDARPLADPNCGGVGRVGLELVAAYAEAHPEDTLHCLTTGRTISPLPDRLTRLANVRHHHLRIPNKLWSALSFLGLASFSEIGRKKAGTIDACFFPNLGFFGRLDAKVPTFLLIHDLSFLIEPRWFTRKQNLWHKVVKAKRTVRHATHLFAVSETTKRDAMTILGTPEERITVIPIGGTLAEIEPRRPERDIPERFMLALGATDPRKNAGTAVEAVEELRKEKEFEDVGLVLVGASRASQRLAPTTILRPSDAELAWLYQNASAFLYPSWYEGFGLPLHEAARFGTPCIASTAGALPETAPEGTIFVNPAKTHLWTEALKDVFESPASDPPAPSKRNWKDSIDKLFQELRKKSTTSL